MTFFDPSNGHANGHGHNGTNHGHPVPVPPPRRVPLTLTEVLLLARQANTKPTEQHTANERAALKWAERPPNPISNTQPPGSDLAASVSSTSWAEARLIAVPIQSFGAGFTVGPDLAAIASNATSTSASLTTGPAPTMPTPTPTPTESAAATPLPDAPILTDALAIAALGIPVFPCGRNKKPNISEEDGGHGFKDASTDPDEIRRLFAHSGTALIGIPTGTASGVDVLDFDYRNGAQAFEDANRHRLPETRTHQTMSGGRHLLFVHAPGVRNSQSDVAPGVDVRGQGGYAIWPPSPGYSVLSGAAVADWPDWLLPMVLPPPVVARPAPSGPRAPVAAKRIESLIQITLAKVAAAPDGQKHDVLLKQAHYLGGLVHYGEFTADDAVGWLIAALPDSVKDWANATKTAHDGLAAGQQQPIVLEDRPFNGGNGGGKPISGEEEAPAYDGCGDQPDDTGDDGPTDPEPPPPEGEGGNGKRRQQPQQPQQADDDPVVVRTLHIRPMHQIPPRQWAYGNFLLFGQSSALGALDGGGKGAMAIVVTLAMITGRPLLGERVWRTGPVVIITYEDDVEEWERRIAAACHHYNIPLEDVDGKIHFIQRKRAPISFAALQADGRPIMGDGDAIIAAIKLHRAVLLIVDPFNHCHDVADGNNNALIAKVAAEMNRVARESGAAVLVLHHLRKGSTGQLDDLMGATSLRATFRITRILCRMTAEEATALGNIPERWRYSRISGSKENYAPPPDKATWFKLESLPLGNADAIYVDGDNLQVTTSWTPPAPFAGMDAIPLAAIFAALRDGPGDREYYLASRKSDDWAGHVITQHVSGKSDDQAATILKQWTESGVIAEVEYASPKRRKQVERYVLNDAKAAAIMASFNVWEAPPWR